MILWPPFRAVKFFFWSPKKKEYIRGPPAPRKSRGLLQRPPKRLRGINIARKCSNVHPKCPQYARNNFCQPCPALDNTTTSSKLWKTRESRVFHCHIGKSQLPSPFRDPKNDPETSISPESVLMCTHCTRNMLGTTFVSHTQPWKTPTSSKSRKTRKSRCFTVT